MAHQRRDRNARDGIHLSQASRPSFEGTKNLNAPRVGKRRGSLEDRLDRVGVLLENLPQSRDQSGIRLSSLYPTAPVFYPAANAADREKSARFQGAQGLAG